MKRKLGLLVLFLVLIATGSWAQNYNPINYSLNGIPVNGVKIKTNLPFTPGTYMPTIIIEGYNYGTSESIGLIINYYVYSNGSDFNNPANYYFHQSNISSHGGYAPDVYLAVENGKVIIFMDQRDYYQRFSIRCFAQGMYEQASWFTGWSVADEANAGYKGVLVPYKSRLKGDVVMPGGGLWNSIGNVGIGTGSPDANYKLSVNGKIRAKEIKVETSWADFVFAKDYKLPTLQETEKHIKEKGHLPGIPSAAEVAKDGIELGDINKKLLQKIEELTLYLIELNKTSALQNKMLLEQKTLLDNHNIELNIQKKELVKYKQRFHGN